VAKRDTLNQQGILLLQGVPVKVAAVKAIALIVKGFPSLNSGYSEATSYRLASSF